MKADSMRLIEEAFISRERPPIANVATLGLALVGATVILVSLPLFLTGLFAGPAMLSVSLAIAGIGGVYLLLSWGFHGGCRWAWCGAAFLTPPLALVASWMAGSGYPPFDYASWMLGSLVVLIQSVVWRRAIRQWFWSHQSS